jgi:signal transduction histidine kinase/CheY-like chemotaxis protein
LRVAAAAFAVFLAALACWPQPLEAQQPRTPLRRAVAGGPPDGLPSGPPAYLSVRDVTDDEIEAIERVKSRRKRLLFANERSSELFRTADGRLGGAVPLMAQWLAEFFGIEVEARIVSWDKVLAGMDDGTVDFTAEMTPTPERAGTYFMTTPIAERPIAYLRLPEAQPLGEILKTRPVRYVYFDKSVNFKSAQHAVERPYVAHRKSDLAGAWNALTSGECDAIVVESPIQASFDQFGLIEAEDILPLVTSPVSLASKNPELAPFVSAVQKYMDASGPNPFAGIYREGASEYRRSRFLISLGRDELKWADERTGEAAIPILVGLEYDNYPICFFNEREGEFQGIAVDILNEIRRLTGLDIRPANDRPVDWAELLRELETGEIQLISELLRTPERLGRYHWTDVPYMKDRYLFISLSGFPDVSLSDVPGLRVGLTEGTAHLELFTRLFPGQERKVFYRDSFVPFRALELGEIDLMVGSGNDLLSITNFMERPAFKANLPLGIPYESYFGVSLGAPELSAIISAAQKRVDTEEIVSRWRNRVFDYRGALARERMPYMVAGIALMASAIALLGLMFAKSKRTAKGLEETVAARTLELTRQIAVSERENRAKSDFLTRTSHEIRTPMNAIIGFSELAQREFGKSKGLEYIRGIRSAGGTLLAIINDILDFSKIESGSINFSSERYRASSLLNDAITLARARLVAKPVKLVCQVAPDVPQELSGDSARVRQILMNLLSNAVKYTDSGQIILSVGARKNGEGEARIAFEVSDTGIGIRAEDMGKLFEEFTRLEGKRNIGVTGTGLGLAIARSLCRAMGGDVDCESVYGEGSAFRASFVQKVADWTPMGPLLGGEPAPKESAGPSFLAPEAEVLVVDDYASNLMVAEGLLAPYGMRLSFAAGGLESVGLVRERSFDLILMDHMMPDMDGIEAVKAIRDMEGGRHVPVAALTANAVAGMREMYLSNGFDDYLTKPIDPERLDRLLARWIPPSKRLDPPGPDRAGGVGEGGGGAGAASGRPAFAGAPEGQGGPGGGDGRGIGGMPESGGGRGGLEVTGNGEGPEGRGCREDQEKGAGGPRGEVSGTAAGAAPGLPDLAGVDAEKGAARVGGPARYLLLLDAFRRDAEAIAAGLEFTPDDGQLERLRVAAHALKGACANIGAAFLSAKAASLEAACRDGDGKFVERELAPFKIGLEHLILDIRELSAPVVGPAANGSGAWLKRVDEGGADEFRRLAAVLSGALEAGDIRLADARLAELREAASGLGLEGAVSALADGMLDGDFAVAQEALDALKREFSRFTANGI